MCNRDGIIPTLTAFLKDGDGLIPKDSKYMPCLSHLKVNLKAIEESESAEICKESYTVGFLSCFHLFRLQLEADQMDFEELQINIENLTSYITYLEDQLGRCREQSPDNDSGV